MRLATANVLHTLTDPQARTALTTILEKTPQIVALQEWGRGRDRILRNTGTLTRLPRTHRRVWPPRHDGYAFAAPITGGPPVGIDAAWGEIVAVRSLLLAPKGRADRATRGVEATIQERATGHVHMVLNIHLLAHHDRAAQLRAWRQACARVERWAWWYHGYPGYSPWVLGDVNRHLLDLPPLVSCWHRHPAEATGPHGGTIDGIWGNEAADDVDAFGIGSDHRAVVADYI